jgi:hypothetical protein
MNSTKIVAFIFGAIVITACDSSTDKIKTDTEENQSPIVNAGTNKSVEVNKIITLVGTASDSDGNIISYEWTKGSDILANSLSFEYRPTVVGTDKLTLSVTDNDGDISKDSVDIVVQDVVEDNDVDSLGAK